MNFYRCYLFNNVFVTLVKKFILEYNFVFLFRKYKDHLSLLSRYLEKVEKYERVLSGILRRYLEPNFWWRRQKRESRLSTPREVQGIEVSTGKGRVSTGETLADDMSGGTG